jgi:hypothetical protein
VADFIVHLGIIFATLSQPAFYPVVTGDSVPGGKVG